MLDSFVSISIQVHRWNLMCETDAVAAVAVLGVVGGEGRAVHTCQ
jgi:hypothetical protein